jgi:hypothetical protein
MRSRPNDAVGQIAQGHQRRTVGSYEFEPQHGWWLCKNKIE